MPMFSTFLHLAILHNYVLVMTGDSFHNHIRFKVDLFFNHKRYKAITPMSVSFPMIFNICILVSAPSSAWTNNRVFASAWLHGSKFDLVIYLFTNTLSSLVQIIIPSSHLQVTTSAVILNSSVLFLFFTV